MLWLEVSVVSDHSGYSEVEMSWGKGWKKESGYFMVARKQSEKGRREESARDESIPFWAMPQ